jgi:hypothetical protein
VEVKVINVRVDMKRLFHKNMKSCEKHNQKAGFDLHGMITIAACRMLKKFGIQTNF